MTRRDAEPAQVISLVGAADERLVRDLRDGRPQAQAQLVERLFCFVDALVWRSLGADDEHPDVVSDVMVALLSNASSLRSGRALEAWARAVTLNELRSLLRRRRVRRLFRASRSSEDRFSFVPDLGARLMLDKVFGTLDQLGAEERLAFCLRYLEGLKLDEVATALRVSLATAKRRLQAAETAIEGLGAHDDWQQALRREGARDEP